MENIEIDVVPAQTVPENTEMAPVSESVDKKDQSRSGHHNHHHHHHHHDGNHHSHHKSKRSKSKKRSPKSKLGKFLSKYKSVVVNSAVILLAFLSVFAIAYLGEMRYSALEDAYESSQGGTDFTDSSFRVEVSLFDKEVTLVSEAVAAYMKAESSVPVSQIRDTFQESADRLDVGAAVTISYHVQGVPKGCTVQSVTLVVTDEENDSFVRNYTTNGDETSISVKHLKTGTRYAFKLTFRLSSSLETSVTGTFRTAAGPRVLSIGGLVNVRDIGGWMTASGKMIRQGLLYRGSELDGAMEASYRITPEGVSDMLTLLGIRSELDLRTKENTPNAMDALGANVTHKFYACQMYQGIFTEQGMEAVKNVFSDLAKPETYPAYLHCTYGADRTGTICYLLEALLGVSEEDLIRDYELSGLVHAELNRESLQQIATRLDAYSGKNIQEKVVDYLISIGVTADEINSIREIFLGT